MTGSYWFHSRRFVTSEFCSLIAYRGPKVPRPEHISPARHDHLLARVEVDPVAALQMEVAVKRTLPSGKWIKRQRLRHAHVDSNHPAFDFVAKLPPRPARSGEHRGHVAQRQPVDQVDRAAHVADMGNGKYRSEDLVASSRHCGRHLVQDCGADK